MFFVYYLLFMLATQGTCQDSLGAALARMELPGTGMSDVLAVLKGPTRYLQVSSIDSFTVGRGCMHACCMAFEHTCRRHGTRSLRRHVSWCLAENARDTISGDTASCALDSPKYEAKSLGRAGRAVGLHDNGPRQGCSAAGASLVRMLGPRREADLE